jgi:hypothetical protein
MANIDDIPCASEIVDDIEMVEEESKVDVDSLIEMLKQFSSAELMKIMKTVVAEVDKKMKLTVKGGKTVTKKTGSMPKGVVPPQLRKPRAWVEYVMKDARENGWESFTITQTKKNKETGERETEEIEMPCSVLHEGVHIYEDSIDDKNPNGKQLIHKDAMSLSKHYWSAKEKSGTREDLYREFEDQYDEDGDDEEKSEKELEKERKKAEKEAEKEAKKAEKEAEKERKKAEKEAEKEAKKAEKEAEKASKKVVVPASAVKKVEVKKAEVKKEEEKKEEKKDDKPKTPAIVKKAEVKKEEEKKEEEKPKTPTIVKKTVVKKADLKKDDWSCPDDGGVRPWTYKKKQYYRNYNNEVWKKGPDGLGDWVGVFIYEEDRFDETVPEPMIEEEEDA